MRATEWFREWTRRLLGTLWRKGDDGELDEELRFHLYMETEENLRRGMSREEAERVARIRLGGLTQVKEAYRDQRGIPTVETFFADFRYGFRLLRRSPVLTVVAVVSLALGIGANTAIFSIVDSLLLKTLPVREPQSLVLVASGRDEPKPLWVTYRVWEQIRDRELFEDAFAWSFDQLDLAEGGPTDLVDAIWASGSFFDVLGVAPVLGRTFHKKDDGGERVDESVVVISYGCWKSRFGGDRSVLGKSITIERVPFTVIGIMPTSFFGPEVGSNFDIAVPLWSEPLIRGRNSRIENPYWAWLRIMARLDEGQTIDQATMALRQAQPQVREATLPDYQRAEDRERYLSEPLTAVSAARGVSFVRGYYRAPLLVLMVVVALVLLIACSNVANLLLARGSGRSRELGMRAALGASRWRIARQLLTESLLISAVATVIGMLAGYWSGRLLVGYLSTEAYTVSLDLALNWRVLAFATAVGLVTAILFGTAPARRATRVEPAEALQEQRPSLIGTRRLGGGGSLLIVAQVALSLVLLVGAGLFICTYAAFLNLPLGFQPDRVLVVEVNANRSSIKPHERRRLYSDTCEAARTVPGVRHAATSLAIPIGRFAMTAEMEVPGGLAPSLQDRIVHRNVITPDWFQTLGTRLLAGRDFSSADSAAAPPVVIVNEAFVDRFMKAANPLGRVVEEIRHEQEPLVLEVIGVVEDVLYRSMRQSAPPTIYIPFAQAEPHHLHVPFFNVVVQPSMGSPTSIAPGVAAAISDVEPDLALTLRPMSDRVRATFNQERVLAFLAAVFGGLALLLAAVGLYGVIFYAVARRRREIAIRMALGADWRQVVGMVLGRAAALVVMGIILGWAVSYWAVATVQSLLFGLPAREPTLFGAAAVLLVIVAAIAAWSPARRAARLDPSGVLREG